MVSVGGSALAVDGPGASLVTSVAPAASASDSPSPSASGSPSLSPSPSPSPSPTPSASPTATPSPSPSPSPTPTPAPTYIEGIDVSKWQSAINWSAVAAAGKRFAFIKATEGTDYIDPYFATNYANAKAAGLVVGAYDFAWPGPGAEDGSDEADWFLAHAVVASGDLPPVLDLEVTNGLSVAQLQAWVKAYVGRIYQRTGVRTVIYTSPNFWSKYMGNTAWFAANGYTVLWIAHWTTAAAPTVPAAGWGGYGWTFWQYTSSGTVPGITGRVDLDRFVGAQLTSVQIPSSMATAGDSRATVTWAAAASSGGSAITGYRVTSSPGAKTCTTATTACTVTGLTNGTSYRFTVSAISAAGTGPASAASAAVTPVPLVVRYAGTSRFDTAAAISAHTFNPGVGVAYIATAYNFPDALAGAAAAGTVKGPVLLVAPTGAINAATATELTRLKPARIIVLGSTGVVSAAVASALVPYATTHTVVRYAGADRFATAAAISAQTFSTNVPVAYIATAYNFPDALAGAAAAGTVKGPVLLVAPTGAINAATTTELTRLKPARIIVLGSAAVVSEAVKTALVPFATSGSVVRYAGADRFATAAAISAQTFSTNVPVAYIATAYNFPDALAGAAAAGTVKGPVLLVAPTGAINAATATELTRLKPARIIVLGSTGVVSAAIMTALAPYTAGP